MGLDIELFIVYVCARACVCLLLSAIARINERDIVDRYSFHAARCDAAHLLAMNMKCETRGGARHLLWRIFGKRIVQSLACLATITRDYNYRGAGSTSDRYTAVGTVQPKERAPPRSISKSVSLLRARDARVALNKKKSDSWNCIRCNGYHVQR